MNSKQYTLGLDFGTATTCAASVLDYASFIPEIVPLAGNAPFENSSVFLDVPGLEVPLINSASKSGRSPLALFAAAEERFARYWCERVKAQSDGIEWSDWVTRRGREAALLLTYFKPELADYPVRRPVRVPVVRWGTYDALAQSDDVEVVFIEREAATPEPDTDDLVASTAAIFRESVRQAHRRSGGRKLSLLALGMPSFGTNVDPGEVSRARDRRLDAVKIANIREDYGSSDFRVDFVGEAQAAAFALELPLSEAKLAFAVIIDVGAGTTDMALVPYERSASGRLEAAEPVFTESTRFAGRDLNLAVAMALMINPDFRKATKLLDDLDRRSWQLIMDQEVERIKRSLTSEDEWFDIRLAAMAGHVDGCEEHELRKRALRKIPRWHISTRSPELRVAIESTCKQWREQVTTFLQRVGECVDSEKKGELVAIELVGGAFRFEPLKHVLNAAVRAAGLDHVDVRFRDKDLAAQTAVARGLAYWAAKQ